MHGTMKTVQAVKATGKKQFIIAGVVVEFCVAFPALSALEEEFLTSFVITDSWEPLTPSHVMQHGIACLRQAHS